MQVAHALLWSCDCNSRLVLAGSLAASLLVEDSVLNAKCSFASVLLFLFDPKVHLIFPLLFEGIEGFPV